MLSKLSSFLAPPLRFRNLWRYERSHANLRASRPAGIAMTVVGALLFSMETLQPAPAALFHSLYLTAYVVLFVAGAVTTVTAFLGRGKLRRLAPTAAVVGIIVIAASLCILDQMSSSDFAALFIGLFSLVVLVRSSMAVHTVRNLLLVTLSIAGVAVGRGRFPDSQLVITAAEAFVMSIVSAFILERYAHAAFLGRALLRERNSELKKLVGDLQDALENVKRLRGLLPICASCKRIRDDTGYWHQVENYMQDHSEAEFSHGICPDCIARLYPDLQESGEA